MRSTYATTDPYKGRTVLMETDSGHLTELQLPRGFTKFRFIGMRDGVFWLSLHDRAKGVRRFARGRLA